MRIRTRLLLALLLLGATAVLAASAIGYRNARSSMIEAAERQLTGVRRAKAFAVESYFRTVTNHVRTLSEAMMFVQGMEEFRAAFREIDGPEASPDLKDVVSAYYRANYLPALADLVTPRSSLDDYLPLGRGPYYAQYWYLVNNPAPAGRKQELDQAADGSRYSEVHARFHPSYRRLVERFGYADLMLVDDRTGRVVYTVMRIGVNSGPVVAGVIGASKFIYDLWGDTVNIASRMESHGVTGAIHVTRATWKILKNDYEFESRGTVEIKGKGPMETWLLRGRAG
jgi:hypothetical protein